jgi:hypothetical protein
MLVKMSWFKKDDNVSQVTGTEEVGKHYYSVLPMVCVIIITAYRVEVGSLHTLMVGVIKTSFLTTPQISC